MSAPPTDKTFHIWFSLHVFVNFMKKEPSTNSYAFFDYFSQIYETKVWNDQTASPQK